MALVKGIIITVVLLFTGNFALQEYIRLSATHDVIDNCAAATVLNVKALLVGPLQPVQNVVIVTVG